MMGETDWRDRYERLLERFHDMEAELRRVQSERDDAEFKVRNELEPRIQREQRNYDLWATSPDRGQR